MAEYEEVAAMPNALAQIVAGALADEGFDVTVDQPARDPYGIDAGWFATRVLVTAEHADQARQRIAEIESSDV